MKTQTTAPALTFKFIPSTDWQLEDDSYEVYLDGKLQRFAIQVDQCGKHSVNEYPSVEVITWMKIPLSNVSLAKCKAYIEKRIFE